MSFREKGVRVTDYFRRQLADYVEYHRDPWNCTLHVFGIVFLFLAAILPLTMWPISVFGVQTTIAALAVLPVLTYWLVLDAVLGIAIARRGLFATVDGRNDCGSCELHWHMDHDRRFDLHRSCITDYRTPGIRASTAGASGQSVSSAARSDVRNGQTIHCVGTSRRSRRHNRPHSAACAIQRYALCGRP